MGVFFRSLGIFKGFLKFFRSLAVFKASPVLLHMIYNIYYMFKAPYIVLTPCIHSSCAAGQEDHNGAAAGQGADGAECPAGAKPGLSGHWCRPMAGQARARRCSSATCCVSISARSTRRPWPQLSRPRPGSEETTRWCRT